MFKRKKTARKFRRSLWTERCKRRRLAIKHLKKALHDRRLDFRHVQRAQLEVVVPEPASD